jgi:hypothetical protein
VWFASFTSTFRYQRGPEALVTPIKSKQIRLPAVW